MVEVIIKKSNNPKKKYDALVNGKTVSFGASGYEDFTIHKDEKRKDNYLKRHQKTKTGIIMKLLVFTVAGYYGIYQQLKHR